MACSRVPPSYRAIKEGRSVHLPQSMRILETRWLWNGGIKEERKEELNAIDVKYANLLQKVVAPGNKISVTF